MAAWKPCSKASPTPSISWSSSAAADRPGRGSITPRWPTSRPRGSASFACASGGVEQQTGSHQVGLLEPLGVALVHGPQDLLGGVGSVLLETYPRQLGGRPQLERPGALAAR